ncbi:hypothetical protein EDB92DRAFT_1814485 [Lactarius akahatsu]|uniref:Uncharacterized protein n=1 Tax=Lactarius akahatsu TaxID=416441 RepID=A0AAD4LMC6_9AGAM|nr:hypothetical protein EDB92DRAFT_1814485 [Lactarius akahatsu]
MQTLRLWVTLATEATKAEGGMLRRLALWSTDTTSAWTLEGRGYRCPHTAVIQTATNSPSSSLPTEAAKAEEGPSRLALWTRPPLGSALSRVVFPSGAQWEPEAWEWSHSLRLNLFFFEEKSGSPDRQPLFI